ncbi:hypothetical protein [Streptacidiphilus pinicola]|uniref:hypothetical protein n=1 Tax=Streptacidiphilus pinicola TaxID=2219663 RepID=UPI001057A5B6|nr:hypothetical protein [Streptacidiphilus pinicola]
MANIAVRVLTESIYNARGPFPGEGEGSDTAYTVAEITTPIVSVRPDGIAESCEPSPEALNVGFERSLEALFLLLRAYRAAEKSAMRYPTRERLGTFALYATRPARPEDGGWDGPASQMLMTMALKPSQAPARPGDDDATGRRVSSFVQAEIINHPMITYGELRADAYAALREDGDRRAAVLLAYTASEVLLDQALMMMHWEEGSTPRESASVFSRPLMSRVRADYQNRIGGSWSAKGSTVTGRWRENLVLLRHKVAHGGYMPTGREASGALQVHADLVAYLFDRIAIARKKFPATAGIMVSEAGFERRGVVETKSVVEAIQRATVGAIQDYSAWMQQVVTIRLS